MLGERLKTIRKENNLKQSDLAILLNVSTSTIGMYEQGRRDPDTKTLKFLSNYFHASIDWLLGLSNIRNPYKNKKDMLEKAYLNIDKSGLVKEDIQKIEEYVELLKQKNSSNINSKIKK